MAPKAIVKQPAVAGAEDHGGKMLEVGELYSAEVAEGMNKFIQELAQPRAYVGTSAFLIFALKYRMRVIVWYGLRSEDLLAVYAPGTLDGISNHACCHAVCCKRHSGHKPLGGRVPFRRSRSKPW